MDRLKKILKVQSAQTVSIVLLCIIFGILGSILMDCVVYFIPDDEMTVFPLGTLMSAAGILIGNLIVNGFALDPIGYRQTLAMGGTRKEFILHTYIIRVVVLLICVGLCILFSRFEMWKCSVLFPDIPPDDEIGIIFSVKVLFTAVAVSFAAGLLITALIIRFGNAGRLVMLIIWIAGCLFIGFINRIPKGFLSSVPNAQIIVPAASVALGLAASVFSFSTMLKKGI